MNPSSLGLRQDSRPNTPRRFGNPTTELQQSLHPSSPVKDCIPANRMRVSSERPHAGCGNCTGARTWGWQTTTTSSCDNTGNHANAMLPAYAMRGIAAFFQYHHLILLPATVVSTCYACAYTPHPVRFVRNMWSRKRQATQGSHSMGQRNNFKQLVMPCCRQGL